MMRSIESSTLMSMMILTMNDAVAVLAGQCGDTGEMIDTHYRLLLLLLLST